MRVRSGTGRWVAAAAVAAALVGVQPGTAFAGVPANDNFSDASSISSLPFADLVDVTQATTEPGEPYFDFCGPANEKTIWYELTPTETTVVRADTAGSTEVPISLGAYRAAAAGFGGLTPIGCARDGRPLDFRVDVGETYYLQAGLLVFVSATIRTSVQALGINDEFSDAMPVTSLPFTDSRNTRVATAAADDPSCAGRIGKTVWYSFTPEVETRIDADTFGSNYETTLSVYTGTRGTLTQVACNERSQGFQSRVIFTAAAGTTYHLMVGGVGGDAVVHVNRIPPPPPPPTAGTFLFLAGEPGDWVGGTLVRTLTSANSTFTTRTTNGTSEVHVDVRPFTGLPDLGAWWFVDLAAPDGQPLGPGTYEGAVRWPFQPAGVPGLSVSGDGRGCNEVTGRFVVHEARYGSDGALVTFDASFEQHCEGGPPALFGRVRIESPDTVPPVLSVPLGVVQDATAPIGTTVDFTFSAIDDVDGAVPMSCSPSSGSLFPVGSTTVDCVAADASGNSASASFVVHVRGASEQLDELAGVLAMDSGPGDSLHDKIEAVHEAIAAGDAREACAILAAFARQLEAQRGKSIPAYIADTLLSRTGRIRAVLAC